MRRGRRHDRRDRVRDRAARRRDGGRPAPRRPRRQGARAADRPLRERRSRAASRSTRGACTSSAPTARRSPRRPARGCSSSANRTADCGARAPAVSRWGAARQTFGSTRKAHQVHVARVVDPAPPETRRPVSLHDVAREAGVHSSTASRALTGATDRPVNPETRDRVIACRHATRLPAERDGAQPQDASSGAIGMLVPSLRNPFWSQMMRAVVRRASERELVVLLAEDTGDEATEEAYGRLVAQARIDGLIVTSASARSSLPARVLASGAPCVFAGRGVAGSRAQRAARRGARLAARGRALRGARALRSSATSRGRSTRATSSSGASPASSRPPRRAASRRASSAARSTRPAAPPRRSACSPAHPPRPPSS